MPDSDQYKEYYLYGSYGVGGVAGLLLIFTLCNCKNIRIGIAVMKCTAQFISQTPQVFLVPPFSIVFIVAWLLTWLVLAIFLASVGEITQNPDMPFMTTVIWSDQTRYALLYSLFGYLWMNAFIIAVAMFIISAAAALWYFTSTSDTNGSGSILKGLFWAFRYHLGSLAFGAFLIALVQFIRIIFEYYRRQIEKANKNNPAIKVILCLTSYLLDCLERFVKFISKNAYIQVSTVKAVSDYWLLLCRIKAARLHRISYSSFFTMTGCDNWQEFLRRSVECLHAHPPECDPFRHRKWYRIHI